MNMCIRQLPSVSLAPHTEEAAAKLPGIPHPGYRGEAIGLLPRIDAKPSPIRFSTICMEYRKLPLYIYYVSSVFPRFYSNQ